MHEIKVLYSDASQRFPVAMTWQGRVYDLAPSVLDRVTQVGSLHPERVASFKVTNIPQHDPHG